MIECPNRDGGTFPLPEIGESATCSICNNTWKRTTILVIPTQEPYYPVQLEIVTPEVPS